MSGLMVIYTYNASTEEAETERSRVRGYPRLQSIEANLGYVARLFLKRYLPRHASKCLKRKPNIFGVKFRQAL